MILADIVELDCGATERDVPLGVNNLVGNDHVIGLKRSNAGLGVPVGDEGRAEVLEMACRQRCGRNGCGCR
jgi:hypothetical protein